MLILVGEGARAADRGADGSFDKRDSAHFVLFQDVDIDEAGGFHGSRRFEREILDTLERAYDRLDKYLGLRPPRKISVLIYDPGVFDSWFSGLFRFAAAGFYNGVIRIRGDTRVTVGLSRVLHHELVHAALHAAAPSYAFPGWYNEGLAEWFDARALGKRRLSPGELDMLARAKREGGLFPLSALSGTSFSHLGPGAARLAYAQAYGMIDYLARSYGERKLRQLCEDLVRSRDMSRSLNRVYRTDLGHLEADFISDL